jgi:small GTP-binding protein
LKLPARLWLVAGAALLALIGIGMVLQLINQLTWQLSAVLPYPLVGPVLLVLLLLVLAGALQLSWPWLNRWLHPLLPDWLQRRLPSPASERRRAEVPAIPQASSRREAAARNLEAIDRILEQVRDAIEREGLREERERMAAELARGDLQIVVFGAGSTGKTSLIRALLRELVGEVGAAMGSTTGSQRYRLRLRGLERAVWLVDTPGILEAGAAGERREQLARRQASRADLLLLVVDGDLRAAEREVFEALASLGKRLILVLNKSDLRGELEVDRLIQLLRQRTLGRLPPEDVVAAAASPQSIPRSGRKPFQPLPEVETLLRRIAEVLHAEGEELIADNLLLQCRRLGEASRDLLARQRRADALAVVDRMMWIGAGVVAVTPLPGVDLLGAAVVNAQMVLEIGKLHGVAISREDAQELALTVGRTLAGLGLVKGAVGLLGSAMAVTLPTALVSRAVQAVGAAWLTRVAGLSFIRYFEQNQSWGDGGVQEVVQQQYELSRRDGALRAFLELALRRVVEPLKQQLPPQRPRAEEEAGGRDDPSR